MKFRDYKVSTGPIQIGQVRILHPDHYFGNTPVKIINHGFAGREDTWKTSFLRPNKDLENNQFYYHKCFNK